MKQDPDYFGEQELQLIYIAKRLEEALSLENLFTGRGIDYLVEPDTYTGGVVFRRERVGAFFYVRLDDVERSRVLMMEDGWRPLAAKE